MLEQYVKRCKAHGARDAVQTILGVERGVDERFAADKHDWDKLPGTVANIARDCVVMKTLDSIVRAPHVSSELNGETCVGVYMIADLYNELMAARKALNAVLIIINNINPVGDSDNADNHAE